MNHLKGLRVYLSGNCENAEKAGADWRKDITPKLKKLGLVIFDPVHSNVPLSFCNKQDEFEFVKKLRKDGDYVTLRKAMSQVVAADLRMCDVADCIIVYLDSEKPTYGTIDEIVTACNQKKPVYLVCKQGMKAMPLWLFGRVPLEYMCENLEQVLHKLDTIDKAKPEHLAGLIDKRWFFPNVL
jgi:nucleoside 2-deoxyribosyltransferase